MTIRKRRLSRMRQIKDKELYDEMREFKEPDEWTIIAALNRVLEVAEDSQLSDEFWETIKNPLAFLRNELGLTNIQIVVLAVLIESGDAMTLKGISEYINC